MKNARRILSLVLAFLMVMSLGTTAFAAEGDPSITLSVDKAAVAVGENVTVTIGTDKTISDIFGCGFKFYADSDVFEVVSIDTTFQYNNQLATAGKGWIKIAQIGSGNNLTIPNPLATIVLKAKKAAQTTSMYIDSLEVTVAGTSDEDMYVSVNTPAPISVEVKEQATYTGYAVSASEDKSVTAGETAQVAVTVSNSDEAVTTFNAYDLSLTYDTDKLTYVSAVAADTDASVTEENGTIRVKGYGADKDVGTAAVTLNFTAKAIGDAEVSITSAKVDIGSSAIGNDAPDATILDDTTVITVSGYPVTLSKGLSGADVAVPNEDYTFRATDAENYDYVVTATMGGEAVEVIDNGDGTYTIKNVTGALVISATMTQKPYTVTVQGSGAADAKYVPETVEHGKMVQFLLQKEDGYDYTITVTIGGESYDGMNIDMDGTCTIPGEDVTGDVVITVTKTAHVSEYVTVTKPEWVSGNDTAEKGQNYFFTITKEEGYEYSEPTVTIGDVDITANVVKDANGTYMIPGDYVTDNIVITVTKTTDITVDVVEYITLNNQSMFLVTVSGTFPEGNIAKYDGMSMFWSEEYNAYAYLVISADSLDAVKAAATEKVTVAEGTAAGTVDYTGDVNGTTVIDVNDAQLTYDMYNAKYDSFETVSMLKFLNADVNADKTVSVADAAAIIAAIK